MTREETKQAAEVMIAFADGKKIEEKRKDTVNWHNVPETQRPCWDWFKMDYRIAPNQEQTDQEEPKEKHYRPYTMEEFVQDMHKHDGFVKNSLSKHRYGFLIIDILDDCVCLKENNCVPYDTICEHYVWSDDGTPCGKEVTE